MFRRHEEHTARITAAALSGEMLLIAGNKTLVRIWYPKRGAEEERFVRRQKTISQRQMAKIGIANTSIAKASEVKSSPCSCPCTSSAIAGIPAHLDFA